MKTKRQDPALATYAQMGMAALLPGMQYTLDRIEALVAEFRAELARLQSGVTPQRSNQSKGISAYWSKMSPAQRKAEMKRRREARGKGKGKKRMVVLDKVAS